MAASGNCGVKCHESIPIDIEARFGNIIFHFFPPDEFESLD